MKQFSADTDKSAVFKEVEEYISELGFSVVNKDEARPWGGFLVIEEKQAPQFISTFFPHLSLADFEGFDKLSPKILLVAPQKRLSWQYHHRRSEIWKVIGGNAAIAVSDTDQEGPVQQLPLGSVISLKKGERHRLIGVDEYGVVAEIWQHTDATNPSDEDDIVRVQDDFGR
jgi:mannose-6-phosphate isomerase